jgi:hypothetical protein
MGLVNAIKCFSYTLIIQPALLSLRLFDCSLICFHDFDVFLNCTYGVGALSLFLRWYSVMIFFLCITLEEVILERSKYPGRWVLLIIL